MSVERRPVHHGVAGPAMPAGMPAAVSQTGDMADEDLIQQSPSGCPFGQRLGGLAIQFPADGCGQRFGRKCPKSDCGFPDMGSALVAGRNPTRAPPAWVLRCGGRQPGVWLSVTV